MIDTLRRSMGPLLVAALLVVLAPHAGAQDAAPDAPPLTPDAVEGGPNAPQDAGADAETDAGEAPAEPDPAPALIVRDLVVLQADHYGSRYNDPSDFTSTLFNNSPRRRKINPTPNATPMPLGLMTIEGETAQPLAIRIDIADEAGRFLGHWPRAVASERYLVWHDIKPVANPAGRMRVPNDHWLAPLRNETALQAFNTRGHPDRFFAYDATFAFTPALTVDGNAEDGYTVAGETLADHAQVMVVRRTHDGWLAGTLEGADAGGATRAFTMRPVDGPDAALAPILAVLKDQGYSPAKVDTAAAILRESAFGDASMSLIYLLGRDALDAALPIRLNTEDAELRRVGIVVVNNVEPDIAGTVGGLIVQLGSDDWATRNAAQRALIEMDRAAIELVRANADHADPEVVYRIEQVIAAYEQRHGE